jgi:hypothetical protein
LVTQTNGGAASQWTVKLNVAEAPGASRPKPAGLASVTSWPFTAIRAPTGFETCAPVGSTMPTDH